MKKALIIANMLFASATVFGMSEKDLKAKHNDLMASLKHSNQFVIQDKARDVQNTLKDPALASLVNMKDNSGSSFLDVACANQINAFIDFLLEHGADTSGKNLKLNDPLVLYAQRGYKNIVKYMVKHGGSDINEAFFGDTVLVTCIDDKNYEMVRCLVELGVDLNKPNWLGEIPLILLINQGQNDLVKYFVDNGAKVDAKNTRGNKPYLRPQNSCVGDTPLHVASRIGNMDLVKYFVDHNANLDLKNSAEKSPLYEAIKGNHTAVAEYLMERNANLNDTYFLGKTLLHLAVDKKNPEMVTSLIDKGVDVDAQDTSGITALHMAIYNKSLDIVKILVERGHATLDIGMFEDVTPLRFAGGVGNVEIIRYLIDHGASLKALEMWGDTETVENSDYQPDEI